MNFSSKEDWMLENKFKMVKSLLFIGAGAKKGGSGQQKNRLELHPKIGSSGSATLIETPNFYNY